MIRTEKNVENTSRTVKNLQFRDSKAIKTLKKKQKQKQKTPQYRIFLILIIICNICMMLNSLRGALVFTLFHK